MLVFDYFDFIFDLSTLSILLRPDFFTLPYMMILGKFGSKGRISVYENYRNFIC